MMKRYRRAEVHQMITKGLVILIAFSLPFSIKINSYLLILFALNWLVEGRLADKWRSFLGNKMAVVFAAVFPLYLLGMLYTEQVGEGLFLLEKSLSLLLMPVVISSTSVSRKTIEMTLAAFVTACLIATVVSYVTVYQNYLVVNDLYLTFAQGHFRDNYVAFIKLHPTYFTLYLNFSMIVLVYFLGKYRQGLPLYLQVLAVLLLVYFLGTAVLLSARMPLLALTVIGLAFSFAYFLRRRWFALMAVAVGVVAFLFYLAFTSPWLNKRFKELSETGWSTPQGGQFNSTTVRIGIMHCALEGLRGYWLTGLGTGDVQTFLNQCYQERNFIPIMYRDSFNLHNAYLQVWLSVGVLGLAWILLVLGVPLVQAFRLRYFFFLAFLMLMALTSLTESVLNTQKGVVFFSFFYCLLAFQYHWLPPSWGLIPKKAKLSSSRTSQL